jgi:cytochrome c
MTTRIAGLLLLASVAVAGCGGQGGGEAAGPSQADQVALAALPAPYNAADLANGREVFKQCRSCHMVAAGAPNLVGPNLHGVFQRRIGTQPDYTYSEAAKAAGWQWTPAQLDGWLQNPRGFLPGTKMAFAGVKEPTDRRDVIGYLLIETNKPEE